MGPCQNIVFTVTLIVSGAFGYFMTGEEEKNAIKFVAQEDTLKFIANLSIFGEEYGKSWMVIPSGDGIPQFALLQPPRPTSDKRFFKNYDINDMPDLVKLFSYTKANPEGKKFDPEKIDPSLFDPSKPTKIICHGWMASSSSSVITGIRDAYLENQNVNIIGVDWSAISKDIIYPNPASATSVVGAYIGSVIDLLVEKRKANYNDFHIVGHSLGAHVSGFAGNNTSQKIGRITGLDPALPGFQFAKGPKDRLDSSDANFVDIIHTCAGVLGISITAGHVDFFPNGGSPFQPGCSSNKLPTSTQSCSHGRSHQYFAESIRQSNFKAVGCADWEHFKKNECKDIYTNMGEYTITQVRGPFYLRTGVRAPFALGINGTFYDL